MQLNLQFGNIQLAFLVHSPSLAQVGQLGLESLILGATTLLAVIQHPGRVLVALVCLGPVWAVTLMSTTISTRLTKDCRFRDHWGPWGCFGCCCSYEEKCFFKISSSY